MIVWINENKARRATVIERVKSFCHRNKNDICVCMCFCGVVCFCWGFILFSLFM